MTTPRDLHPIPLAEARLGVAKLVITLGHGQWDAMLSAAYDAGWVLLELDADEQPVAAYQRELISTGKTRACDRSRRSSKRGNRR
jgi:hypothetical protein